MRRIPSLALVLSLLALQSCTTILATRQELGIPRFHVVLTFDDGPYERPDVDAALLDVLERYGIKAYFCLIGSKIAKFPDSVRDIASRGHEIVFHSWNHESYLDKDPDVFAKELEAFDEAVSGMIGRPFRASFVRPPFGFLSIALARRMEAMGLRQLCVTNIPSDGFVGSGASDAYMRGIERHILFNEGGQIVLHNGCELSPRPAEAFYYDVGSPANREWLARELEVLIKDLLEKGYGFDPSIP